MEKRFQKRRVLPNLSTMFVLEDFTEIEWSISRKQHNGRAYKTNNEEKKNHFDHCFEFDTNTNSRFVRKLFYRLSKYKSFPVVYITINQKESNKIVYFGNFFYHWLEIEQLGEILFEISKFELNFEKRM